MFTFNNRGIYIILLIYVDDILITGNNSSHISHLIHNLNSLFSMKDLGSVHYFLGIVAVYNGDHLHLTQHKYIVDLLKKTKLHDSRPYPTPVLSGKKLSVYDGVQLEDLSEYRSIVEALQYLTLTRPNICYAVNQVCQFMHSPTNVHWVAVKTQENPTIFEVYP
ncbi:putative RNA-directed DNA polymerase [Rosa chinensis]|uniref:Putative RNA-directed DNA polymerase n=1 Tax=Rosa chinensis TaxID=74649 RepID=A0A2P6RKB3_ROSCH|nr:putative RNA-directed DNA polymerase [Rosa chinensis]